MSSRSVYWDACVFIDFLEENPERISDINAVIFEVDKSASVIYTSQITVVEVSYPPNRGDGEHISPETNAKLDRLWYAHPLISVVEFNPAIARIARDLIQHRLDDGWRLKPMDAIHLATARWIKNTEPIFQFHTYDNRLQRYSDQIGIPIVEPKPLTPTLGIL